MLRMGVYCVKEVGEKEGGVERKGQVDIIKRRKSQGIKNE